MEKELGVWITSAAELLDQMQSEPPSETKESKVKEFVPEKVELGKILLDEPNEPKVKEPVFEEVLLKREAKIEEVASVVEEKPQFNFKISDETKKILQKAIHKPPEKMNEMLESEPEKVRSVEVKTIEKPAAVVEQESFTATFNQKVIQEQKSTDKFAQLLSLENIHNKFDCLIACAYHLVERENFERFTLKQVNTLAKAFLDDLIEHDTLKEALERRFIKIVPDYTGIANTMEYTLTEQGINYFKNEIAGI